MYQTRLNRTPNFCMRLILIFCLVKIITTTKYIRWSVLTRFGNRAQRSCLVESLRNLPFSRLRYLKHMVEKTTTLSQSMASFRYYQ